MVSADLVHAVPELAAVMESSATRVASSLWNCRTKSLRSELQLWWKCFKLSHRVPYYHYCLGRYKIDVFTGWEKGYPKIDGGKEEIG